MNSYNWFHLPKSVQNGYILKSRTILPSVNKWLEEHETDGPVPHSVFAEYMRVEHNLDIDNITNENDYFRFHIMYDKSIVYYMQNYQVIQRYELPCNTPVEKCPEHRAVYWASYSRKMPYRYSSFYNDISFEMACYNDDWKNVIATTFPLDELYLMSSGVKPPYCVWTHTRVYFQFVYDGSESCTSVGRDPEPKATMDTDGGCNGSDPIKSHAKLFWNPETRTCLWYV